MIMPIAKGPSGQVDLAVRRSENFVRFFLEATVNSPSN